MYEDLDYDPEQEANEVCGKVFDQFIEDIKANYAPEEVFSPETLAEWAEKNGYIKVPDLHKWAEAHGYIYPPIEGV